MNKSNDLHSAPNILVLSAPSGCGKTTLAKMLTDKHGEKFSRCVTSTTRNPRGSEVDGKDYYFLSLEQFQTKLKAGEFLEYAKVFGNLYGTGLKEVKRINGLDKVALLVIDVQGHSSITSVFSGIDSLFILPPSIKELWKRLTDRGTDDLQTQYNRLSEARNEISQALDYKYYIINDNLEQSFQELEDIAINQADSPLSKEGALDHITALIKEFEESDWILDIKEKISQ